MLSEYFFLQTLHWLSSPVLSFIKLRFLNLGETSMSEILSIESESIVTCNDNKLITVNQAVTKGTVMKGTSHS